MSPDIFLDDVAADADYRIADDEPDLVLEHIPSGSQFKYSEANARWELVGDLDLGGGNLSSVGSLGADEITSAKTHYVPAGRDLQSVIDAASANDRIIMAGNHSYTSGITVDKKLRIEHVGWGDPDTANVSFSGLGVSEDMFHVTGDGAYLDGLFIENTDGSGRDAYNFDATSAIKNFYAGRIGYTSTGTNGFMLRGDSHLRANHLWGFRAPEFGLRDINASVEARLYADTIYLVGNGGSTNTPSTLFSQIGDASIGTLISAGGGASYGGDAFEGVRVSASSSDMFIGQIKVEDTTNSGVRFGTSTTGDGAENIAIGSLNVYECAKTGGQPVRMDRLKDSMIMSIRATDSDATPQYTYSVKAYACPGVVIGAISSDFGFDANYSDERVPLRLDIQGDHLPGAVAGDLAPRQYGFDPTNGRIVWKDASGTAYYAAGTAL